MRQPLGSETFFAATAVQGRLRLRELSSPGPWDPRRLTYLAESDLEVLTYRWTNKWAVRTVEELDQVLQLSQEIRVPIRLYVSETLVSEAQQRWEGNTFHAA